MSRSILGAALVMLASWGSAGCAALSLFGSTHTHQHTHECDCGDRLNSMEARLAELEQSRHAPAPLPTFP